MGCMDLVSIQSMFKDCLLIDILFPASELVSYQGSKFQRRSRVIRDVLHMVRGNADGRNRIQTQTIRIPTLFVQANHDNVLQPAMSKDMEKYIPSLTRAEVDATHWILMQKPDEVNAVLQKWLVEVGFGGRSML